ncbi:MAG: NAD(P)/FAD-dependent oxidoreductase [Microbacteriaceae bacterium]
MDETAGPVGNILGDLAVDTVVVGAGQAGLATGFHLAQRGVEFVMLEANQAVGESWRNRWDSLRLFTPARYSGLPGLKSDARANSYQDKDEFAGYLSGYAEHFALPIRPGVRATGLSRQVRSGDALSGDGLPGDGLPGDGLPGDGLSRGPLSGDALCAHGLSGDAGGYRVTTTGGTVTARTVVVATGPNALPSVPGFAHALNPSITQLHSSQYRNPESIPPGDVLVVGAGTSGAEIALELAAGHRTFLAGRPTAHIPDTVFRLAGGAYWAFLTYVLTLRTPLGRKVATKFHQRGAPLLRVSMKQVEAAGVVRVGRVSGVHDGWPMVDPVAAASGGGTVGVNPLSPTTIIWATGYRPDLDWLPALRTGDGGLPVTRRGVVEDWPGLYFVGMPFQYALTSGLVGGVGRDAAYIADQVVARVAQRPRGVQQLGTAAQLRRAAQLRQA